MRMTIYEILLFCEKDSIKVVDINDNKIKIDIKCKTSKKECDTSAKKLTRFFCTQLELGNYHPEGYSEVYLDEFIEKNKSAFELFKAITHQNSLTNMRIITDALSGLYNEKNCNILLKCFK